MQTRQYPRTMQAAFGPHTDNNLQPMPDAKRPFDWQDKVVMAGAIATAAFVILIALEGLLA